MMVDAIDHSWGPRSDFKRWTRRSSRPSSFKACGIWGCSVSSSRRSIGLGLSNAGCRLLSESSSHDSSCRSPSARTSSIAMKGILLFGTAEQKARYLEARERGNDCGVLPDRIRPARTPPRFVPSVKNADAVGYSTVRRFGLPTRHCGSVYGIRTHLIGGGQDHGNSWSRRRGRREPWPARG